MITRTEQEFWIAPPPAYAFDGSREGAEQAMSEYFSLYADGQSEPRLVETGDVVSGRAIGDPTDYTHTHVFQTGDRGFYIVVSKPSHSDLGAHFALLPDIWCGRERHERAADTDPFVGPFADLGGDLESLRVLVSSPVDDDEVYYPHPEALTRAAALARSLVKKITEWSAPGSILRTYACVADGGSIDLFFESATRKVLINVTPDPRKTNYAVLDNTGKSSSAMMTDILSPIVALIR